MKSVLTSEIPKSSDVKDCLTEWFKANLTPIHMKEMHDYVAEYFELSEDAINLKLDEVGRSGHSHAKDTDATVLDQLVGRVVQGLLDDCLIKRVGSNIYENSKGPDKEVFDTPGLKAAATRSGVSFIIPSVKILLEFPQYKSDHDSLVNTLVDSPTGKSQGWDNKLVRLALDSVLKS